MSMKTYQNPILFGEHADPSILLDGNEYFMVFSSCFGNYGLMQMWKSEDLVNWEPLYHVLEGSKVVDAWAPELIKHGDTYYIYNYAPGFGCFVTTTKDIRKGQWSEAIKLEGVNGIDPGHVADEEGNRYLVMSSNYMYPLAEDGLSVTGEAFKLCEEWEIPDEIDMEGSCPEAPKFFKRGEYYYFMIAQGGTVGPPTSHGSVYYRSKNVKGPYEMSPYTPVIHTTDRSEKWWSKGHSTVFQGKDGEWYMVYHAIENSHRYTGRICLLMPVEWDENQWFYVSDDDASPIPMNGIGEKKDLTSYLNYKKGEEKLSPLYNYCTNTLAKEISFTKEGIVVPALKEEVSMESMITYQHQSHCFTYEVTAFLEENVGFSIGFWYQDTINCGICVSNHTIGSFKHGKPHFVKSQKQVEGNQIIFKMCANDGTVSFYYKTEETEEWTKWPHAYDVADYNPNVSEGFGYARSNIAVYGTGKACITDIQYSDF